MILNIMFMICPSGSMSKEKRWGPSMEPWGTAQVRGSAKEEASPTTNQQVLFEGLNQSQAVSLIQPTFQGKC